MLWGSFIQIHTFLALHLHFFHFICSTLVGSGLNSMYMHAYVLIRIGTILYAAPFVNSRAAFDPGSTQLARLGTVYLGKHAASPQHPSSSTRNHAGTGSAYLLVIWLGHMEDSRTPASSSNILSP